MDEHAYREAERRLWETVGLEPTEHEIRLATTGTTVRVQEVGHGEPTLFLHGGPNAGSTWAGLLQHIDGLRCLLPDRPGTGLSEPYRLDAGNLPSFGARLVADLLDRLGLERAHLVAASFGSPLALRAAAATPDRVDRMVHYSCPAMVPGDSLPPFFRLMRFALVRRALGALPPSPRANRAMFRQLGHARTVAEGRIPAWFEDWYPALQRHTDTARNDGELIGRLIPAHEELRLREDLLADVKAPTLFLWGEEDPFGGEAVARRLVGAMPNAELRMIPNTGHLPPVDFPEMLGEATTAFLTASTGPPVAFASAASTTS
jgi:2-hydroxy-6-oxonona-2,4-dienedioate hydrolase